MRPGTAMGVEVFQRSLAACLCRLRGWDELPAGDVELIRTLCAPARETTRELIEGVPETLSALARRHVLVLFTKGEPAHQQHKIASSGLAGLFWDVVVIQEKNTLAYQELVTLRGLDPARTWMIGNSPRSDISPAQQAGLGTVFIPHPMTWSLELDQRPTPGQRSLVVSPFSRLLEHF